MNKNIVWSLLFVLAFIVGCDDENDPFAGNDNFITSFSLRQGEQVYPAFFRGDTILLVTPEGISLQNVKAEIVCSENSTIIPDPATVENWEQQQYFVVTSHSGIERKYLYIPSRSGQAVEGIILLNTQAEVDAFGAKGVTHINGSLIIGRQVGTDTITSLAALTALKRVSDNVILNTMFKGYEFTGLDNLEEVGGSLHINAADSIWTLPLNKLASVGGDFNVTSASIAEITCPALKSVGGSVTLAAPFVKSDFSALQQVSGALALKGKAAMQSLSFQSLERVGETVEVNMSVVRLEFPELRSCDKLTVVKGSMALLYCPKLQDIATELNIADNPLYEVSFPELTHIGTVTLSCPKVSQMSMPLLKEVDGDLNVTLLGLDTEKLGALERIGGKLSLSCTAEYLKLPAGLKNLKVFMVSKGIERLDIQGIEIEELQFSGTGLENTTVIGDDIFKGKISLENLSGYFPKLEGFREVGKLNIGYLGLNGGNIEIGNIRKINGDFSYWANSNVKAVELPALEEVTGNFELYSSIKEYHFPELKSIGGKAIISIDYYDEKTFPNLATVGGDMMFQTGYDYYGSRGPAVVLYPALKQVGGTLDLRPIGPTPWGDNENTGYSNQTLENLDFLSTLEKVGGIRIHDHGKLASYEAIKKAILTCPEEKWSVENNLYNPTYKQLVEDQQWTKPAGQE